MTQIRQLAAIMFTDIQGYTAMMQHDEGLAMKIRDRHRKIFNQTTEKFNGSILQYFGDGTLSTFKSAIDAVHCAMEMQIEFQKEPVIPVRIGVHLGDIVVKDDEIIGDGVNVASRIESLAVAGSVFISDKVYDEIRNQSGIEATSLKTFEFKNVDKPIEVFAISNKGMVIPREDEISGKTKDAGSAQAPAKQKGSIKSRRNKLNLIRNLIIAILAIVICYFVLKNYILPETINQDEKAIAVLPFTNMTNDPEQEYFSDGITEDILTHLSKVADLRVVSRTSVMQYKNTTKTIPEIGRELGVTHVLEGSVRKYGSQVRITAQLIDANTDEHIWAEAYDRELTKIFDIQSEVATEILKVLKTKLTTNEKKNLEKVLTSEITAYDYYLRGMEAIHDGQTQKEYQDAARFFIQAIQEDSGFAAAYVGLAWTWVASRTYGVPAEVWSDSAYALNQKALSLDPDLDEANFLLGVFYFWSEQYTEAEKQFERVLELNPNHEHAMMQLGETLLVMQKYDEGMELIIESLMRQLNRKEPEFYLKIGQVYLEIKEYEQSKKYLQEALSLKQDYIDACNYLIEIAYLEENWQEAQFYAQKAAEIERNIFSLDRLAWTYLLLKDYQSAAEAWRELGEIQDEYKDKYFAVAYKHRLAYALWQLGHKEEADKLFEEQVQQCHDIIESQAKTNVAGEAYDLAGIYSFQGNEAEALKWALIAEKKGFLPVSLVDRDPMFENLRQNSEFKRIIEEKRNNEEKLTPKFEKAKKKIREMEEMGVLTL